MKIKTHKELAAFMAGVEVGRVFKMMEAGATKDFVWFESFNNQDQISVHFQDGSVYYESFPEGEENPLDEYKHHALIGIHTESKARAKELWTRHKAKKAEQQTKGAK